MESRKTVSVSLSSVIIKIAALSALSGTAVFFCLAALFSAVLLLADIPFGMYHAVSSTVLAAGCYVSGLTGGYAGRRKGILTGMLCSLPVIFTAVIFFHMTGEKAESGRIILNSVLSVCSGAAGGVRGVNTRIKRIPFVCK